MEEFYESTCTLLNREGVYAKLVQNNSEAFIGVKLNPHEPRRRQVVLEETIDRMLNQFGGRVTSKIHGQTMEIRYLP